MPEPETTALRLNPKDVLHAGDVLKARQAARLAASEANRIAGHDVQWASVNFTTSKGAVAGTLSGPLVGQVLAALHSAFRAEEHGLTLGLEAMGISDDAPPREAASHGDGEAGRADPS